MSEPVPAIDPPFVGRLIRFLVGGLPLGLFIMGALSFILYFQKRNAAKEVPTKPSQLASMMRRDINADDLARYQRIFTQDIGPRTPDQKENMEIAVSFITSTMGFDNMGYQVVPRPFDASGKTLVDLTVDLVGTPKADQFVSVIASYAADKEDTAAAISALMALAQHFTGTKHARSLRFVAQAIPTHPMKSFPDFLEIRTENLPPRKRTDTTMVLANGAMVGEKPDSLGSMADPQSLRIRLWRVDAAAPSTKVVAELNNIAAEITKALDGP